MSVGFPSHHMTSKRKISTNQEITSIKIAIDVVEIARVVAAGENVTLSDLISDILRPILLERRRVLSEKWAKEAQGEPKGAKGKGQG